MSRAKSRPELIEKSYISFSSSRSLANSFSRSSSGAEMLIRRLKESLSLFSVKPNCSAVGGDEDGFDLVTTFAERSM